MQVNGSGKRFLYLRQKESLSDIESKDYMSIKDNFISKDADYTRRKHEKENHHTTITKKSETFNGNKEWICQTDQGRITVSFPEKILQDGCNWHPIIFILNNIKEI